MVFHENISNNETIDKIKKSGWRDVEIFSWKTIALYVQLIDLKDHLEVCLPCSRLLSGHSKLLDNQNLRWSFMKMTLVQEFYCFTYKQGYIHILQGRQTSKWSFKSMSWTYSVMIFYENISNPGD